MVISGSLPVIAWLTPTVSERGVLVYSQNDASVKLENGRVIHGRSSDTTYVDLKSRISGDIDTSSIDSIHGINLKPSLVIEQPYLVGGGQLIEDVFPPSTAGFYGRLQAGKSDAMYFIHEIRNSDRSFLSITDLESRRIYENHVIHPFEAEALHLVDDMRIRDRLYTQFAIKRGRSRKEILSILDAPAPSWKDLTGIIGEVTIPNLHLGKTMRETLTQIVPSSFPQEIREELMAFLAHVIESKIPDVDPLTYSFEFSSIPLLESLLNGHLMCLIDGTEWPSYVKLMTLAARGQLEAPKKAVSSSIMSSPWLHFSHKCTEFRPNWLHIAIDSAKKLNKSNDIVLGLPTTKSQAKRSQKMWKKRFAEISHGFRVRGQIDAKSLGLVELVYLGAAYRWPHRHMKFISRLGGASDSSHLQVMIVPFSAVERLKRALPSILTVSWSARTSNLNLFDEKSNQWRINIEKIISSIQKKS